MNKSLIALAVFTGLTTGAANAAVFHAGARAETAAALSARPLQLADRGFSRTTTATNRAGKTAERKVKVDVDAESKTRTRTVEGTTFEGKSYSGQSSTQLTADGYVHSGSQVGPNGGTRTREVTADVDREDGTITKDISVTGPNGETRTATVVRHYEKGGDGAE